MKNAVAIIEFGSKEIITLVGELGVNNTLNILGKGNVSYAGFQNSEFLEPENLRETVKQSISKAESQLNSKITEIYVGVPGEFSVVVPKTVSLIFPKAKKITQFDVDNIFRTGNTFEKETNYCLINKCVIYYELDDNQKVIDPLDIKSRNFTGNISYILADIGFVKKVQDVFSKLRISIKGFISSMLAEAIYLFEPSVRDRYVLIADVGYITTSIVLGQGNGLLYSGSFSLGGAYIASDLSQCLRISFSEAEKLKEKLAILWQPSQEDNYAISINENVYTYSAKATNVISLDRVEMICDYIQRCINSSGYELPNFIPLYLTGGGISLMKGIRNLLSKRLRRQVITPKIANEHRVKPYNIAEEGLLYFVLSDKDLLEKTIIKI